ncbi:MAG TPA: hypothetical protein VNT26_19250, partial [Candidatus Sulfotelmatobacter sp.]|nr:hypothetical protein [Candidatus Sulfotelmatobacter sp.]
MKSLSVLRGFSVWGQKRLLLVWLASLWLAMPLAAQWVHVDPNFPTGSGPDATARTVAVESDGRVLVGGWFTNVSGV